MVVKGRTDTLGLGLYVINPQDIIYVEQNREHFAAHCLGSPEPIKIHGTTKEADAMFPFLVRIQRTYLVNMAHISSVHSRVGRVVDVAFKSGAKLNFIKSEIHHDKFMKQFSQL
jgi:DNA-binding LytR/AlgR family response regulator